ncbi:MAG: hypothetical protein ACREAU_03135 [Nitrosopumilaceae archaeon]
MAASRAPLYNAAQNTQLKNRVLWYDGDSTIKAGDLLQIIKADQPRGILFVDSITDEIKQYNLAAVTEQQFNVKTQLKQFNVDWNFPDIYRDIDITKYIGQLLQKECFNNQWDASSTEYLQRQQRVINELKLYEKKNLFHVLRALIYIINTLEHTNVVWGVGRGSSVGSYVLYLLKVHDVDSVFYELDISDFMRDK